MTPVDSPHVLLTRAAERLELLAARAIVPPWGGSGQSVRAGRDEEWLVAEAQTGITAEWIATLSPAVAPHLVAWLRQTAKRSEWDYKLSSGGAGTGRFIDSKYAPALAFARTVLGMEAETPDE